MTRMDFKQLLFPILISILDISSTQNEVLFPNRFCVTQTTKSGPRVSFVSTCSGYRSIDEGFLVQSAVRILDMSNGRNIINDLPTSTFYGANLVQVEVLNLSNCVIRSVEDGAFYGLGQLRIVDLSYNQITVLNPAMFDEVTNSKLEALILSHNQIQAVLPDTVFPRLPLTRIELGHTMLKALPLKIFEHLNLLDELTLNDNQLTLLDWRVFDPTTTLRVLRLENNPWKCDCHIKFLRDFMAFRNVDIRGMVVCWDNISLGEVDKDVLLCPPHTTLHRITPKSETTRIEVGQVVQFICDIEGYPLPQFAWLKNKEMLLEDDDPNISVKHRFVNETGNHLFSWDYQFSYQFFSVLTIKSTRPEDSGEYACYAKRESLEAMSTSVLTILDTHNNDDSGVTGWKLGSVFAVVFIFVLSIGVGGAVFYIRERRKRKRKNKTAQETDCRGTSWRPLMLYRRRSGTVT